MKRLILFRHAKAVSKDAARDFDRALAAEGREEARVMAAALADLDRRPDLALVSPSRRTRETWTLAGSAFGELSVRFDQAIYEATTRGLLKIVQGIEDEVGACIVVGHNPSFEDLALELAASSADPDREPLRRGMPTGSAAVIDFDIASWREITAGEGRLAAFLTPQSATTGN